MNKENIDSIVARFLAGESLIVLAGSCEEEYGDMPGLPMIRLGNALRAALRSKDEEIAQLRRENEPPKPCPFCGGIAEITDDESGRFYFVLCPNCRARGPWSSAESEALRLWNTRAEGKEER